jgi:catechol 2,3-dioxygenase
LSRTYPILADSRLPEATRLGQVNLWVADLARQVAFYTEVIGLQVVSQNAKEARLGAGGPELLRLTLKPGGRHYEHHAGLYHFCLATPQRFDFARLLRRILQAGVPLQGLVDHHVAEAIYLPDAEGNGVELNWDRKGVDLAALMSEMARRGNGPLDVEGLLALADESGTDDGKLPPDTYVGHIHLHVADLQAGRVFYHGAVGFDITAEFPGAAVFTSAGGYHHHVAFNIWNGRGAAQPPADATGLRWFTVLLPKKADLDAVLARLKEKGHALSEEDGGWKVEDPAGNWVRLMV